MTTTTTHIGTQIREVRRARGLTQQQLARELNIPVRTLRAYEQNMRVPDKETLYKIAIALNVPVDYILREKYLMFVCRLDDIFGSDD
jgi:transcriptional regulator with XRE-family HTH domain